VLNPRRRGVDIKTMAGWRASCSFALARRLTRGAMGLTVAWWAIAAPAWGDLTDISLTPASGAIGTEVTVSGDNCRKVGQDLSSVHLLGISLGVDLTITPEPNGSWSGGFTVPSEAIEGPHVLVATCTRSVSVVPYVPVMFTVTAEPTTVTTSSVGTTVVPPTTALSTGSAPAPTPPTTGFATAATSGAPASPSSGTAPTVVQPTVSAPGAPSTAPSGQSPTTAAGADQDGSPSTSAGRVGEASGDAVRRSQDVSSPSLRTGPNWYLLAPVLVGASVSAWQLWRRSRSWRRRVGPEPATQEPIDAEGVADPTATMLLAGSPRQQTSGRVTKEHPPGALACLDIGRGARAMESRIRERVRPEVAVQLDVDPHECFALLDAGALDRMVLPLVDNAASALGECGTIRIATGRGPCTAASGAEEGPDWALVVVADTGPGMPADLVSTLLESFAAADGGADQASGLATVHGLVSDLGGHLDVSSVIGHGTTVTIALPLQDAPPAPIVMPDAQVLEPTSMV
jgi:hypothetical protein